MVSDKIEIFTFNFGQLSSGFRGFGMKIDVGDCAAVWKGPVFQRQQIVHSVTYRPPSDGLTLLMVNPRAGGERTVNDLSARFEWNVGK